MPPRFAYWTILAGGLPTSFRAADREDLLPTLHRLQERHPDAEMKWFQRGKLWESPEAARDAFRKPVSARNRDWRPGGEHRDPRAALEKRKRERNQARRQQRFARKHGGTGEEDVARRNSPPEKPEGASRQRIRRPAQRPPSQRHEASRKRSPRRGRGR
jgi:hypothetical protein